MILFLRLLRAVSRCASKPSLLGIAAACFGGALAPSIATAQGATGLPTSMVSQPVEHGFVNVGSGNVHLEIPLGQYVERGKLKMQPRLVYNSRFWQQTSNGTGGQVWSGTPSNINAAGWSLAYNISSPTISYTSTYTACSGGGYNTITNPVWTDGQGTQRTFQLSVERNQSGSCAPASAQSAHAYASDSSGYQMFVNSGYAIIVDPQGVEVDSSYIDANGNRFTQDANGNIVDTVGRTPLTSSVTSGPSSTQNTITLNLLNSKASTSAYTGTLTYQAVTTAFGDSSTAEYSSAFLTLTNLAFPDGTAYKFTYDSYGELSGMTMPTGGQAQFAYANFTAPLSSVNRWVSSYTAKGGTWNFQNTASTSCPKGSTPNASQCTQQAIIKSPTGASTVDSFVVNNGAWLTSSVKQSAQGAALSTRLISYDFSNICSPGPLACYIRPTLEQDTVPGASGAQLTRQKQWTYDSPQTGNVVVYKEWKFSTGTPGANPDRETDTAYQSISIGTATIFKPSSITVKDASGTQLAKTLYSYDSNPLTSVTGTTNHDDTLFGSGDTSRGNLTQIQKWVSGSSYLATQNYYDTTGQLVKTTDSKNNTITYGYADSFVDDTGANPSPAHATSAPSNVSVTSLTPPSSGVQTFSYYYGTGKNASSIDQNGSDSYAHYMDPLDRLTSEYGRTTGSGRPWRVTSYTSATQRDLYSSTANESASTSCVQCRHMQTKLDQWGRTSTNTLASDPDGAATNGFSYDTLGRLSTTSNPARSSTDQTSGGDTLAYDDLDRPLSAKHADNNMVQTAYGSGITTSQLCSTSSYGVGYPTMPSDEAGKKKLRWTDGFGQLIEVDQPNASGSLVNATCYQYDGLGNLTGVAQGSQTRARSYDGLSRLVSQAEPESGKTTYTYDSCSSQPANVCTKTDARGITTTYSYDALGRSAGLTFSDGTPAVSYFYDQASANGVTVQNGKGRRTSMTDGSGSTTWSYDAAGNVATETKTVNGVAKTITFGYNPDSTVSSITYPNGDKVAYAYNSARRPVSATDPLTGINYASGATYAAHGSLASVVYGKTANFAGITRTRTYNGRLQGATEVDSSPNGMVQSYTYNYNLGNGVNNSHMAQLVDNVTPGNSQTFTYDSLNRTLTGQSQTTTGTNCWGLSFGYDLHGNLTSSTPTQCSGPNLSLSVNNNNQITNPGVTYDAAGNVTSDGNLKYTWDAQNHLKSTAGVNYTYDGVGQRVAKSSGELTWYAPDGKALAETDGSGNNVHEFIYFNGRLTARRDPNGSVFYYFGDHLRSNRVMTDATGHAQQSTIYLPYGQEMVAGTVDNYKFTGKKRDPESGTDHALYRTYHPGLGRWLSSDPGRMFLGDPESLNRYSYVRGNASNGTDLLGNEDDASTSGDASAPVLFNGGSEISGDFYGAGSFGLGEGIFSSDFAGATFDPQITDPGQVLQQYDTVTATPYGPDPGLPATITPDVEAQLALLPHIDLSYIYGPSGSSILTQYPFNGNVFPGFTAQDGVCSTGPFANSMNSNPAVLACCQAHDACYTQYNCNSSSFIPAGLPGPCKLICNATVAACIGTAVGTGK